MFLYNYNPNFNILEVRARDILTISDIKDHYNHIEDNKDYPRTLKIIIDCRHTKMEVIPEELKSLCEQLENTLSNYSSVQEAILVQKPFETAIAQIFEMYYNDIKNFDFQVFSTEKAALNLLLSKPHFHS